MNYQSLIFTALCAFLSLTTPIKTQAVDFDEQYRKHVESEAEKRNIRATMALLDEARVKAGDWSDQTLKKRLELVSDAMEKRSEQLENNTVLKNKVQQTKALTQLIVECSSGQAAKAIKTVGDAHGKEIRRMLDLVAQGESQYCQPLEQGITQIPQQDPGQGFRVLR